MQGIFNNIKSFDDPVVMPRKETKVTYPHSADAIWEWKAEYFEGLARSFFVAAPLIANNPELVINGYSIKEYYKNHVLRACTPSDKLSVPSFSADSRDLCTGYLSLDQQGADMGYLYQEGKRSDSRVPLWICKW